MKFRKKGAKAGLSYYSVVKEAWQVTTNLSQMCYTHWIDLKLGIIHLHTPITHGHQGIRWWLRYVVPGSRYGDFDMCPLCGVQCDVVDHTYVFEMVIFVGMCCKLVYRLSIYVSRVTSKE